MLAYVDRQTLYWAALTVSVLLLSYWLRPGQPVPKFPPQWSGSGITAGNDAANAKQSLLCQDPGTGQTLGLVSAAHPDQVRQQIELAKTASKEWRQSSFHQRRLLLKILLQHIIDNQEAICRVSALDSGKPMVDAAFGEVLVTCEKIRWLLSEGERWLRPESRSTGRMMFYKKAWVEFHPVGVVGAIVPFNYPFHNIFNPLTAALFAGNGIVIKVSEHASWSSRLYERIIHAALQAAGAPKELVQIVTGYGDAGNALVTGGVDTVIFVGSTAVGKKVMAAAAETLTPVTLELGGKDAFIVLDDADLNQVTQTALRGAFQGAGQNCMGAERFLLQAPIHDAFVSRAAAVAQKLRQGPTASEQAGRVMDVGATCLPGLAEKIASLVDDAVAQGAKVAAGGGRPQTNGSGQFFPPTILTGITHSMRIWREEVFGPVMAVAAFNTDDEAVALANDCPFGLGSSVFSRNTARARNLGSRIEAGMTSINDFAATYMSQSLPFGGVKESGFGRFGGIEGLRALCIPKSVTEDRFPWLMRTDIPPLLQYPVKAAAFDFVCGLVKMFYGLTLRDQLQGIVKIVRALLEREPTS
ncbi:hypothetical protein WJX74_010698 [Apatococcus lobatus]|uniref:Aldehyde dehydrogenase domain-containing protein n=1 Tax=Apatococcus lobatus TaxID=904363 RepID=A0AAW1QV17_9CHLO